MPVFRNLFGRRPKAPIFPFTPPSSPVCVIGDVHGMADLLDQMLHLVQAQAGSDPVRVVLVGDMIDRGPASADVLWRMRDMSRNDPGHVRCLMGNHERMLLDFLADPPGAGPRWMRAGGAETVASFGLSGRNEGLNPSDRFCRLADRLREVMPGGLHDWLRDLALVWQDGAFGVSHAGADPALPLHQQTDAALLWGHRDFMRKLRPDGIWLAHGHVIHPAPIASEGRIAVDTGAWCTGILSAAWCDAEGVRFLRCSAVGDEVGGLVLPSLDPLAGSH